MNKRKPKNACLTIFTFHSGTCWGCRLDWKFCNFCRLTRCCTNSSSFFSSSSPWSSLSVAILFGVKKRLNFCWRFMKLKLTCRHKNTPWTKRESIVVVASSLSRNWNAWHKKYSYKRSLKHQLFRDFARLYKASKHTYLFLNLLLLLPAALEVLIYEKTYFGGFLFVSFFCVSMTPRSFHFASE